MKRLGHGKNWRIYHRHNDDVGQSLGLLSMEFTFILLNQLNFKLPAMLHLKWHTLIFCCMLSLNGCEYNKGEDLGPVGPPVKFDTEIKPILIQNCLMCHSDTATHPDKPGYALFLQGSGDFSVFREYATATSTVNPAYTKVPARLRGIETPAMPFNKPSLPDSSIKKIENWIKQGANLN